MNHLLSQYPVTQDYLDSLKQAFGDPLELIIVSNITAKGYGEGFRFFRKLKSETIYLPVLDLSSQPLLAPLQILAMIARARRRLIVEQDFSTRPFGFFDAGRHPAVRRLARQQVLDPVPLSVRQTLAIHFHLHQCSDGFLEARQGLKFH